MSPVEIPICNRAGTVLAVALVDADDAEVLTQHQWRLHPSGYAWRYARRRSVYMHRVIMDAPDGLEVDHRNRNGLDNRRENLRIVTHAENHQNYGARGGTSKYRNVSFNGRDWEVRIRINGCRHYVGRFATEDEANCAAIAYRALHAPFAVEEVAA